MDDELTKAESGDRTLFGRVYHWHKTDGHLSLTPGPVDDCHDHRHLA